MQVRSNSFDEMEFAKPHLLSRYIMQRRTMAKQPRTSSHTDRSQSSQEESVDPDLRESFLFGRTDTLNELVTD
jgi:hypothetical protein